MSEEISPERQEYLIDLEDMAEIMLESTKPFGTFLGEMGYLVTYPSLVAFFGQSGHEFATLMGFNYTENAECILERVKELKREKEEARERERESNQKPEESWLSRLRSLLS